MGKMWGLGILLVLSGFLKSAIPLIELSDLPGWKKLEYVAAQGQPVEAYGVIDREKRPVLLMISGSKCIPLFLKRSAPPHQVVSRLFITEASFYRQQGVHALAIERKGLHSFQDLPPDIAAIPVRQRCGSAYGGLTKDERVEDIYQGLQPLMQEPWFGPLIIMGHSEGVDVALALANRLPTDRVKAVGLFAGATPNMLFDFVATFRQQKQNEQETADFFNSIIWLTDPRNMGKYGGYPEVRMRSFAVKSTPLDDALQSHYPLYIVNGLADTHASPLGADAFVIELLRKQPQRKIRYVVYKNLDHDLVNAQGVDQSRSVFALFTDWALQESDAPRTYQVLE